MSIIDGIHLDRMPRMADWARWGCAVSEALGIGQEKFLNAYEMNRANQNTEILESDEVCQVLLGFMADKTEWSGTPSTLYSELTTRAEAEGLSVKNKSWPRAAHALTRKLNKLADNLKQAGVHIESVRP
jgi:hypothetical protein